MKVFLMMVRRELWEHPSLWATPVVIALVMLLGVVFVGPLRTDLLDRDAAAALAATAANPGLARAGHFALVQLGIGVPFFAAAALTIISYLLDCLYAERRDRSILFWKSLPVSDAATVLSKLCVALVVTPLLFYAVAAIISVPLDLLMARKLPSGSAVAAAMTQWTAAEWLRTQAIMVYMIFATVLWYAPYAAYLLLVSSCARYSVLALAVLPPLLLALLERLLLGTSYLGGVVVRSFTDVLNLAFRLSSQLQLTISDVIRAPHMGRGNPAEVIELRFDPSGLLQSPQLWIGLALAALMVWAAIIVRKRSRNL